MYALIIVWKISTNVPPFLECDSRDKNTLVYFILCFIWKLQNERILLNAAIVYQSIFPRESFVPRERNVAI